jgi:DNA-binding NarL/FixJ family response regulator
MPTNRPRILIADDHRLVADLCRNLLEEEFEVVGTVDNGRSMVRTALDLKPDVIVLDITMPILNGLDAGSQVKEALPSVKLIYLTMSTDIQIAAEALRRGASGYLLKTCASLELVTAVHDVLSGKTHISNGLCRSDVQYLRRTETELVEEDDRLTPREREVLQLLAEGKVMKEVGSILNMATSTVAFHKYRMMEVLGLKSSAELVRYAVRNHIVAA